MAWKKIPNLPLPQAENEITKFWNDHKIFEKSQEIRKDSQAFSFLDGPPFPSGLPHPAHLLMSSAKDAIPRYQTMKGKYVRRVFGWDCHGIPVEAKVNQILKISTKKEIEKFGIENYVKECRKYVENCIANWGWYIEKIGRWVDLKNAYYTMYPEYHESVLWAFKKIWEKGLIYKGKRVSFFSTETGTPVSDFEVAETDDYRDVTDLAIFVKFKLKESLGFNKPVFIVAWTTTPWTVPSNMALAINPKATYLAIKYKNEILIVEKSRLEYTFGKEPVEIIKELQASELEGLSYEPIYDYFSNQTNKNDHKIYLYENVTTNDGTGVLHLAPAFGEEDFNLGKKFGLSDFSDIDEEGKMTVGPWIGIYLRTASPQISQDLQDKNNLLRSEQFTHRLPFYRGNEPLIYMAQNSYFIDIQNQKKELLKLNENINWIPEDVKYGRFTDILNSAPDWCISRNRYWSTIMPLWKSADGDELVIGSFEEMSQYSDQIEKKQENGKTIYYINGEKLSAHRDKCDQIILKKDGKEYKRVPEVMDVWLDSGSAPFAQFHYPFENKEAFEKSFPYDFICEGAGMVRAWFNVLHRVSTMIFNQNAFNNVICAGTLSGSDGHKMSKTRGNYTDPKKIIETLGGEALRLYLLGSPVMAGGTSDWSDELIRQQSQTVLIPLQNIANFFVIYADKYNFKPTGKPPQAKHILNQWILAKLADFISAFDQHLSAYHIPEAVRLIQPFLNDLSTWYIRRSRDEFNEGSIEHLETLFYVLKNTTLALAPLVPFITENIFQNILKDSDPETTKESIHLMDFPNFQASGQNDLFSQMQLAQDMCTLIHEQRQLANLKIRQPLASVVIYSKQLPSEFIEIIKSETNLKQVSFEQSDQKLAVKLDTNLTPELIAEGEYRDLLRNIQTLRKEANLGLNDMIQIYTPSWPESFERNLLEKTKATKISKSEKTYIEKV